jgi:NADPH2:quinone reductase
MRIVEVTHPGDASVLRVSQAPTPHPGANEILIKVHAAGVNRADLLQREGHYPPPPGVSPILGMEVSGVIADKGNEVDSRWTIGTPVCALLAGGGYAEYTVAPAGQCLPVPAGLSLIDAASLPETVFTVWANLFDIPWLRPGERFLVQGGSSGIGTMAIQMAHAFGARVLTTAGSPDKCAACEQLGADKAINYREADWLEEALTWAESLDGAHSSSGGIDVILDMIGGDYFAKHLKLLAMRGRLVHIAFRGGSQVTVDLAAVMTKQLIVTGSTLRSRSVAEKTRLRDAIEARVWPLFAAGKLRPVIDRVFPFQQVADAHRRMEESTHIGKLLLAFDESPMPQ